MATDHRLLSRIRGEYREMPGLRLTFTQACRLWQLDGDTCHQVLDRLLVERFLQQTPDGAYTVFPSRTRRRRKRSCIRRGRRLSAGARSDLAARRSSPASIAPLAIIRPRCRRAGDEETGMHAIWWMVVLAAGQAVAAPRVVRYEATIANVKYVYGVADPVARVRPGDTIETNTLDAFGNAIKKAGDTMALVKGDNPLTGPFYVEGAQPGDTLAIRVLDLEVDGTQGVGALAPGFGALNPTNYTPMLTPDLPERIWFYDIDKAKNTATFRANDSRFTVAIPMHPFLGCLGVAPPGGEARMSITPGEWGGNLDSPQVSVGHTIYLPVNVPGALLYLGDGHAAQGEGEVAGTGIEVAFKVRLSVDLIKGKATKWPRFETDTALMAVGAYRPVDDALRIAFKELILWIHNDYGLSELDAYELLSKVARIDLNEMVDPNYVVVAIIDKRFLPPKVK